MYDGNSGREENDKFHWSSVFFRKHLIFILCLFIALITFKPSEPYLTEYFTCNSFVQEKICSKSIDDQTCESSSGLCKWSPSITTSNMRNCHAMPCSSLNVTDNSECSTLLSYCQGGSNSGSCTNIRCYKNFSEDQVNNEIYPWSTYTYLPFLIVMGPAAEMFGYRSTILIGICGRVATRFLLIYGSSLLNMQLMQATYSMGSAAEDLFKAYVFYAISQEKHQVAFSSTAASSLLSNVFSGILGDLLVIEGNANLSLLFIISAVFVCTGSVLGVCVIQPSTEKSSLSVRQISVKMSNQFQQLIIAAKNPALFSFILWWICGNASFTIIFGYEVSMYQELNGSNKWNGSALGAILLLGAAGAMAPVWLGVGQTDMESLDLNVPNLRSHPRGHLNGHDFIDTVDSLDNSEKDEGDDHAGLRTQNSSSSTDMKSSEDKNITLLLLLLFLGVISNVTLLLSLLFWTLIPSIAMLGLYFAAWQCISAIFFTQLALSLKRVAVKALRQELTNASPSECILCTYCQRNWRVSSSYINGKVDDDRGMTFNVMNPMTNSSAKDSKYVGLSLSTPTKLGDPLEERKECRMDQINAMIPEKYKHHYIDVSIDGINETHSYISNSPEPSKTLACQCTASSDTLSSLQQGEEGDKKESAPSYSMAIVAVVAASGLLQILLLAVFFSSYAFSLRIAFFLLFFVYAFATCMYVISALWRNDIGGLGKEVCRLTMLWCKKSNFS